MADLDSLQCRTSGGGRNKTSLSTITRTDLVCPYLDECDDWKCYEDCCEQDPNCPCRGFCYPDCSCYNKNNHNVNFMNCTSRNITSLQHRGPIYAKQIYLDGNKLTALSSADLDFPCLLALFVNINNILTIHASAFEKLTSLQVLDLHQAQVERERSRERDKEREERETQSERGREKRARKERG